MRSNGGSRDVVVVGRACRLPGAGSVDELWANLVAGRCSVATVPADRWALSKHGHPRPKEPGRSYVWSAGIIDDLWNFDPSPFGISPREAEQMDPQQRLALELTWEALEDAGIRRSAVAGTEVGVFVGASSTEYQNLRNADMAAVDAYTATGGALSIVANRISHAFDLRGPSFTVDTACSSSLVALHQAMEALRSGRIETAIVGGVNVLLSPFGFVLFSQASMLSPTGLCRTFDAKADGYVRAEGGVVLVLKTARRAKRDGDRVYCRLVASGVNSDGRTSGIALPSSDSQRELLRQVYRSAGIRPSQVSFVEAHGTGTRVGDPIEAATIGEVLGRGRDGKLPIGSVKSNLGHLEPASGLAGVLKAMLALEHDVLPPSLHFDEPNPDIPFEDLNLEVCATATPLPSATGGPRYAGVNSFGFGGTNAHVIVADAPPRSPRPATNLGASDLFPLSGENRQAVRDLARRYRERLSSATFEETREVAAAAAHHRDMLSERAVVEWGSPRDLVRKLERIADKDEDVPGVTWGTVTASPAPVALVFSGNGSQWPGMGREAYKANRHFRETLDEVDASFDAMFGWSISEALFAADIEQRLAYTHIAQPLLFAIQIAAARALAAEGLEPAFVLGHSVGEIATAAVSGALSLPDAIRVIQARSHHQELVRDAGRMAVIVGAVEQIEALCAEVGGIEIAAENSPRTFTVAGPTGPIAALGELARQRRMAFRQLDLDYPFHCGLMEPVRSPLLRDLQELKPKLGRIEMISTVTGEVVEGASLDAEYWWRNVREPVRFSAALRTASARGARIFVEVGPRSVLLSNIVETLEGSTVPFTRLGVLERREQPAEGDPIRRAMLSAFAAGAPIKMERVFGPPPANPVPLPNYPWQRKEVRVAASPEAVASSLDCRWHRLAGARNTADGLEWSNIIDTTLLPELADHQVGGQAIMPGSAYIEIALAVGREWFNSPAASVLELDIVQPLPLEADRSRELKSRLSPATGTIEILSRPRLARAGWTLHATARLSVEEDGPAIAPLPATLAGARTAAHAIYAAAEAVGLRYGPAFRLLASVAETAERQLVVDLLPSETAAAYTIDPARLDAAFHGLFALLGRLGADRRGAAYIPVRFGHARALRPGATPARARIDLQRLGESSIVADFTLFDPDGEPTAFLYDARFQAARVQRRAALSDSALRLDAVPIEQGALGLGGTGAALAELVGQARELSPTADGEEGPPEQLLLDGWATAAGFEAAHALAQEGVVPASSIAAIDPVVAAWLNNVLRALEGSGLAEVTEGGWALAKPDALPASDAILRTIAADYPHRSAELMLAAPLSASAARSGSRSALIAPSRAALDSFELGGAAARAAGELIERLLRGPGLLRKPGLRVLQLGYGSLSHALEGLAAEHGASLTIFDPDPRRTERARLALRTGEVAVASTAEELGPASYDLVVAADTLHRIAAADLTLSALRFKMAPGAQLVAVEPLPSLFRDVALGLSPGWFDAAAPEFPLSPLRSAEEWVGEFRGAGFKDVQIAPAEYGPERSSVIAAEVDAAHRIPPTRRSLVIVPAGGARARKLPPGLLRELQGDGHDVRPLERQGEGDAISAGETLLFWVAGSPGGGDLAPLREACLSLRRCAALAATGKAELWVVARASRGGDAAADPFVAGLMAFARTLANETPALTVRRVSVAAAVPPRTLSERLRALLSRDQRETEISVQRSGIEVRRVSAAEPARSGRSAEPNAKLERGAGGLAGLAWRAAAAPELGPDEIEIEVAATGLNFRDVMWAMGVLPDDILEDGFAGATLGLECAGRVTRLGSEARRFKVGDRVLAFAPAAFARKLAVSEKVVAPLPPGWSLEAAAGAPVAFLTAYYGLVTLGRVKAGEWILIHGAAGGVGLAAIQIAQLSGAQVVATAGSPEKRELVRAFGVEHVLNSRSPAFADEIRRLRPEGVDIVLNSLSGEAMERGLSTLRAFGRFIELGKRDYVANTRVGLRPFRRNLSYFGVDVDQLLSDGDRASGLLAELMALFGSGELRPLPYRVFSAEETLDAFRLMQQSGHIGKIVLRPPAQASAGAPAEPVRFDPGRTHLVTGGFGGFGLEAARWLADRGVRHLVLVGRNGPQSPEAKAAVEALAGRGVEIRAAACDVADGTALAGLLAEIGRTMPPLAGILHGAMVLEDALLGALSGEQLERVLKPKVQGAENLDRLTRGLPLDYFVLFSSITTLIGNPGQAAYVAANGYLEGLARLRRERGDPALAIAWGAIADVGVLARQKGLAEALSRRVGVRAMPARQALDLMAQALAEPADRPEQAVLAIGSLDWSAARRLPVLTSPTFASLVRDGSGADGVEKAAVSLPALLGSLPRDAVRKQVVDIIVEEIASVLRLPRQEVSPTKKLAEVGLDSLMAIELATSLQDRLGLDATPSGSVGAMSAAGLADHLIALAGSGQPDEDAQVSQALNERHAGIELQDPDLAPLVHEVAARSKRIGGLTY